MTWTKELDEAANLATKTGHWHIVLFYLLCGLAAIPTSFLVFSQVRPFCIFSKEIEFLVVNLSPF